MKNTKTQRILSLAFAGVLLTGIIASFAACGSDKTDEVTDYSYTETTMEQTTQPPVVTEEPAATEAETTTAPETTAASTKAPAKQPTAAPTKKPVYTTRPAPSKPDLTTPVDDQDDDWIEENIPNRWQSRFGYCDAYDTAAPLGGMFIATKKMIFNYQSFAPVDKLQDGTFKEKAWRIQLWKGLYNIYLGSEIGVYTAPPTPHTYGKMYKCATDNLLYMEHSLYHNGKRLFATKYRPEWWDTGFIGGNLKSVTEEGINAELCMKGRITFRDKGMLNAFIPEFEKAGFVNNSNLNVSGHYTVEGNSVRFTW